MTHHLCAAQRIGTQAHGDALTRGRIVAAAAQSRNSVRRLLPGALRRSVSSRNARGDLFFYVPSEERQHFNLPQQLWLRPWVPMAVTPGMSLELETLTINLLMRVTCQRGYGASMGLTSKRVRRSASRLFAGLLAQLPAWVRQQSTPRQLVDSPHLPTRAMSVDLCLGLLVTRISTLKHEATMPAHRPASVNFQAAVCNEGGRWQARPRL